MVVECVGLARSHAATVSDIRRSFAPVGLTSRTSTSSGNVWFMLLSVTVTFVIRPVKPVTEIVDG